MNNIKPHPADEENNIFTEGIDYSKTSKSSIWGDEDKSTQELLIKLVKPNHSWVNLASGDGRYNNLIAKNAKKVVDIDIDESALQKLFQNTPEVLKPKVELKAFNITKPFPLESNTYDGLFSSGTLYLFPVAVFQDIAKEISRILIIGGNICLEWAIDIKRTSPNGSILTFGKEPLYDKALSIETINSAFPNFKLEFMDGEEIYSKESEANPPYEFHAKTLLVVGEKIHI